MATFVVSKSSLWGAKSYPLAQINGVQVQATTIQAALGKAARLLAGRKPAKRKINRISIEIVRVRK